MKKVAEYINSYSDRSVGGCRHECLKRLKTGRKQDRNWALLKASQTEEAGDWPGWTQIPSFMDLWHLDVGTFSLPAECNFTLNLGV